MLFLNTGYSLLIFKTDEDAENMRSVMEEPRKISAVRNRRCVGMTAVICLLLLCVVTVFACSSTLLAGEVEEFSCHRADSVCMSLLCPAGMLWHQEEGECGLPPGYWCCQDGAGILTCQEPYKEDRKDDKCTEETLASGVAPSPRTFCYPGFVWVPWRKKCFRKI